MEDEIEFDELDPCCQREILERRKNKSITDELRKYDRSLERNKLKSNIFSIASESGCQCCYNPSDYPLLHLIRTQATNSISPNFSTQDSDSDLSDSELFQDVMELQMKNSNQTRELGFGCHIEESVDHLKLHISSRFPIVCFVYHPDSVLHAQINLGFEQLSQQYMGTLFRRVSISPASSLFVRESSAHLSCSTHDFSTGLLLFLQGRLIQLTFNLSQFGFSTSTTIATETISSTSSSTVYLRDLVRYLDNSHVLVHSLSLDTLLLLSSSSTASSSSLQKNQQKKSNNKKNKTNISISSSSSSSLFQKHNTKKTYRHDDDDDDENDDNSEIEEDEEGEEEEGERQTYCEDPHCTRYFPHEHIGRGREGGGGGERGEEGRREGGQQQQTRFKNRNDREEEEKEEEGREGQRTQWNKQSGPSFLLRERERERGKEGGGDAEDALAPKTFYRF